MNNNKKAPGAEANLLETHNKDTHFDTQYQTVYQSLKERPKTMLEVSLETGILRANICRYVADMKEKGYI
ncbi:MAG: hypothetical protein LBL90_03415, partial [Prevotellaceae bacterium]|nr:hypothetical protein [Prevotellaceae bacterium]